MLWPSGSVTAVMRFWPSRWMVTAVPPVYGPVAGTIEEHVEDLVMTLGNQRALVYFWYHSRGRVIAQNHHKIVYMFLDRARYGRTDGSLVRFTTPILFGDEEAAEATFQEFARSVTPLLPDFVPN